MHVRGMGVLEAAVLEWKSEAGQWGVGTAGLVSGRNIAQAVEEPRKNSKCNAPQEGQAPSLG